MKIFRKNIGKPKFLNAFTLAEVLITLGIIGIVAAMTIPTIMSKIEEQVYLNQFKTTYSILSQAYQQAVQENGTADTWVDASQMNAIRYMSKYLKHTPLVDLNSTSYTAKSYSAKLLNGLANPTTFQIILQNGAMLKIVYDPNPSSPSWVATFDINGRKAPNQWGYDIFMLTLGTKNGAPLLTYPYYPSTWLINTSAECRKFNYTSTWIDGAACSVWILKHWNMDYLKRDIPDAEWIK